MSVPISQREGTKSAIPGFLARLISARGPARAAKYAPEGLRIYAIGDIHGCVAQLDRLLAQISLHASGGPQIKLVFLGDYVDRGPDSKGVIDRLVALKAESGALCLRGNHDQAVLNFLADANFYRSWKGFGAADTLLSYGVRPPLFDDDEALAECQRAFAEVLPESHRRFLLGLEPQIILGDYAFVHAGVRPGVALDQQSLDDLLWIRDDFLLSRQDFGKVIVHGHTPIEAPERHANRIAVDTGAYATGRLSAAVLERDLVSFMTAT